MALSRASDVPASDWLSQTRVKNDRNFSGVAIRFFSVMEIAIKHSSLCNSKKGQWLQILHLPHGHPIISFFRAIESKMATKSVEKVSSLLKNTNFPIFFFYVTLYTPTCFCPLASGAAKTWWTNSLPCWS